MSVTVQGADIALDRLRKLPVQVKYAAANAINDTSKEIQSHTINRLLPSRFTLRARGAPWQKPGNRFGFNIRFANKDRLEGEMGSRADWLKLQEEGGTKSASGHRIAIEAGARETPTQVLQRRRKPRSLIQRGKGFIIPTRAGDALFERDGKELKLLYLLKPSAHVDARLDFVETERPIAERLYAERFGVRFAEQLAR